MYFNPRSLAEEVAEEEIEHAICIKIKAEKEISVGYHASGASEHKTRARNDPLPMEQRRKTRARNDPLPMEQRRVLRLFVVNYIRIA